MKKEEYVIDTQTLKNLGETITKFRKKLREKALEEHRKDAIEMEEDIHDITVLAERMGRGYFKG